MTFQCKYEEQDFVHGYGAYVKRSSRRWMTRFYWALAVLMILVGIFNSVGRKSDLASAIPLFVLAAFWIYCATALWSRAGRRAFSGRPELRQEYKVDIDDSGIVFEGPISGVHGTWPAFIKFTEDKSVFLAFVSPCMFVILPKRLLKSDQADELRDLLKKKLPEK